MAVVLQCIVIQGHVHFTSSDGLLVAQAEAAPAPVQKDPIRKDGMPGGDSGCFICQQAAMAGSAVLPESPAPVVLAVTEIAERLSASIAAIEAAPSHHWRSRAPPIPA